jgi:hypothetical protein
MFDAWARLLRGRSAHGGTGEDQYNRPVLRGSDLDIRSAKGHGMAICHL